MTKEQYDKMKEALRVIAYPKRGTWEERDMITAQDCAEYVMKNFTLDELREE